MGTNPWIGRTTAQLDDDAHKIMEAKQKHADWVHHMGRIVSAENIPYFPEIVMTMAEDQQCSLDGMLNMIKEAYGWTDSAKAEAQDEHRHFMNMRRANGGRA